MDNELTTSCVNIVCDAKHAFPFINVFVVVVPLHLGNWVANDDAGEYHMIRTLDFNAFAAGTIIDDEYLNSAGVTVSAAGGSNLDAP